MIARTRLSSWLAVSSHSLIRGQPQVAATFGARFPAIGGLRSPKLPEDAAAHQLPLIVVRLAWGSWRAAHFLFQRSECAL